MPHADSPRPAGPEGQHPARRPVSRRQFLRVAGLAAASIGAAGGLPALLTACAGNETTTTASSVATPTTGGVAPTTSSSATVSSEPTTTSVSAGAEQGDEIKAGYVLPVTGAMAEYGAILSWQLDWFAKNVWKDGLLMGDKKTHKFTVVTKDTQSDLGRASEVAQDLVSNEKVVLLGAAAGAGTVVPAREVAENFGCPCITYDCPGDSWNGDQPEGGYKWCWHSSFVLSDLATNFIAAWDALSTNKVAAGVFPNDGDGTTFADALPMVIEVKNYSYVDPGRYENGTTDFAGLIAQIRSAGAEILIGVPVAGDYSTFWEQAGRADLRPKVATMARALLLPSGIEALGDAGDGQTCECCFHPSFPYTGAVTGLSAKQVCDLWEQEKAAQWVQPLAMFGQFETWTDVLARCADPTDKGEVVKAIRQTKLSTVGGPVDWTVNPDPYSGFYNFSVKPITTGQWVKGAGTWKYDVQIVASETQKDIATTATVKPVS
jgi:branched-chain amino acid transport system substrate-binding protein